MSLFCTLLFARLMAISISDEQCQFPRKSILIKQAPPRSTLYTRENFIIEDSCISSSQLQDGEVLLKALYISVDPYLGNMFRQFPPGTTASSVQISQVMATKSADLNVGDVVTVTLDAFDSYGAIANAHSEWSTYFIRNATSLFRIDSAARGIPTEYYLSTIGLTGATAYYGLIDIGKIKSGEKILVSGAAGATGSVVGQIAKKVYGAYVVGTAGSDEKVKWLKEELNFDDAINYKDFQEDTADIKAALQRRFPDGIDIYFDNTGGFLTAAVWPLLNKYGRVVVCGQIANYNRLPPKINDFLIYVIMKEIRIEGFLLASMPESSRDAFYSDATRWIKENEMITNHTVYDGFEKTIDAFIGLYTGENIGKMLVKIADIDEA